MHELIYLHTKNEQKYVRPGVGAYNYIIMYTRVDHNGRSIHRVVLTCISTLLVTYLVGPAASPVAPSSMSTMTYLPSTR